MKWWQVILTNIAPKIVEVIGGLLKGKDKKTEEKKASKEDDK